MADESKRKGVINVRIADIDNYVQQMLTDFKDALRPPERDPLKDELKSLADAITALKTPLDAVRDNTKPFRDFYATGGYSGQASRAGGVEGSRGSGSSRSSFASNASGYSDQRSWAQREDNEGLGPIGAGIQAWKGRDQASLFRGFFQNYRGLSDHAGWGVDIQGWRRGLTPMENIQTAVSEGASLASNPPAAPQIGQYTAQNVLAWVGSRSQQQSAINMEEIVAARSKRYQDEIGASKEEADAEARKWILGQEEDVFDEKFNPSNLSGKSLRDYRQASLYANAGRALHAAAEFAPKVQMAHQIATTYGYDFRTHTLSGTGGLSGTGEQLGVSGQGMDIGIPGFGFRFPLNHAALKGFQEEYEKIKMSLKPGINKTQANFIFDQLYDRGWMGGEQTNTMRDAGANIMQYNHTLGMNPQTYDAMDKSLRYGTTTVNDFVRTMKQVPEAAKSARISLDQMVADANAMGEQAQQQGATFNKGFTDAVTMASQTGLPAGVWGQAFQNPIIQGFTTSRTGLAPQIQGLAPGSQRVGGVLDAVNAMTGAMGGMSPIQYDYGHGFSKRVTGQDQSRGWISQQLGISPEIVKELQNPKTQAQIRTGMEVGEVGQVWSMGAGTNANAFSNNPNAKGSWGNYKEHFLKTAKRIDPDTGKVVSMFSKKEIKEIEEAGSVEKYQEGIGHSGRKKEEHFKELAGRRHMHLADADTTEGRRQRQELMNREAATNRYKKMKQILAEKGDNAMDGNPNKVTVELGPAAKKALHISVSNKDAANAGGSSVNIPFAQGPSSTPSPYGVGLGGP